MMFYRQKTEFVKFGPVKGEQLSIELHEDSDKSFKLVEKVKCLLTQQQRDERVVSCGFSALEL